MDLSRKLIRWIYRYFLPLNELHNDAILDLVGTCDELDTDRCQSGWIQQLRCAVACVSTQLLPNCQNSHRHPLLVYLRKVAPSPSTYEVLVEYVFVSSCQLSAFQSAATGVFNSAAYSQSSPASRFHTILYTLSRRSFVGFSLY